MTRGLSVILVAVVPILYFNSCNSGTSLDNSSISTDSVTIAKGEAAFIQHCSGCHNFRQNGIGPQLGGLTASVSADWIQNFIRDPKKMIESGDDRAELLFEKYKGTMPSFATFTDEEVIEIISFLNTHREPQQMTKGDGKEISNPIADTIQLSGLLVDLELVTQIPASSDSGKLPLARITKLDVEPNTGNVFILDLRGKLYKLKNNKSSVYMDLAHLKPKFISEPGLATGFGSFAFHPEFAKNGLLYTTHTESHGPGRVDFGYADSIKVSLKWVLTEWKTELPEADVFSGVGRELLTINMVTVMHGVQEIVFNPLAKPGSADYGMLYIGVGDGGNVEEGYPFLAHNKEMVWGTILRIDPGGNTSANGQYGIPRDNPFAKNQDARTLGEIYAYGFRNPHRITWNKSGQMLACNIGQAHIESVNLIMPGHDYGWPIREGTYLKDPYGDLSKIYQLPANDSIYRITYPVASYDHDDGISAISGGFEYWGTGIPQLTGKYLFGDIHTGRLFYIDMADIELGKQTPIKEWKVSFQGVQKTLRELCGNGRADLHFGRDASGELYILTKTDGKVYKLVHATVKPV